MKPKRAKVDQRELDRAIEADIDFQEHWESEQLPVIFEGLGEEF